MKSLRRYCLFGRRGSNGDDKDSNENYGNRKNGKNGKDGNRKNGSCERDGGEHCKPKLDREEAEKVSRNIELITKLKKWPPPEGYCTCRNCQEFLPDEDSDNEDDDPNKSTRVHNSTHKTNSDPDAKGPKVCCASYYQNIMNERKGEKFPALPVCPEGAHDEKKCRRALADLVCDLNTSSFKDIVGKLAFVDKTMLIRDFLARDCPTWVTAPSKFGKTTNLDMLKRFLSVEVDKNGERVQMRKNSENYRLFKDNNLNIFRKKRMLFAKYFGKYPVVHVDFGSVEGETKSEILHSVQSVVKKAFREHAYLVKKVGGEWVWSSKLLKQSPYIVHHFVNHLEDTIGPLHEEEYDRRAFFFLLNVLEEHFTEVPMGLVDNCDQPLLKILAKPELRSKYFVDLIDNLVGGIIDCIIGNCKERSLFNRSVPIFVPGHFYISHLNYMFSYQEHSWELGFTSKEVRRILNNPVFEMMDGTDVWEYYGNFRVYEEFFCPTTELYNPWTLLNCLYNSVIDENPYFKLDWPVQEDIINLEKIFTHETIRKLVGSIIFEKFEMFRTTQFTTFDVDAYKFMKLVDMSHGTTSDADDVDDTELSLHALLVLNYLGYLGKCLLGKQGNRTCFFAPSADMTDALVLKYSPDIYSPELISGISQNTMTLIIRCDSPKTEQQTPTQEHSLEHANPCCENDNHTKIQIVLTKPPKKQVKCICPNGKKR